MGHERSLGKPLYGPRFPKPSRALTKRWHQSVGPGLTADHAAAHASASESLYVEGLVALKLVANQRNKTTEEDALDVTVLFGDRHVAERSTHFHPQKGVASGTPLRGRWVKQISHDCE